MAGVYGWAALAALMIFSDWVLLRRIEKLEESVRQLQVELSRLKGP